MKILNISLKFQIQIANTRYKLQVLIWINNSNLNLLRPYLEGGLKIEDYKKILGSRLIANVKKNQLVKKFHFKK